MSMRTYHSVMHHQTKFVVAVHCEVVSLWHAVYNNRSCEARWIAIHGCVFGTIVPNQWFNLHILWVWQVKLCTRQANKSKKPKYSIHTVLFLTNWKLTIRVVMNRPTCSSVQTISAKKDRIRWTNYLNGSSVNHWWRGHIGNLGTRNEDFSWWMDAFIFECVRTRLCEARGAQRGSRFLVKGDLFLKPSKQYFWKKGIKKAILWLHTV